MKLLLLSSITDVTLTTTDIAVFAAVLGFILMIVKAGIWFLDRFYNKRDGDKMDDKIRQIQSEACKFDHNNLTSILVQQNQHISKLLENMGLFIHSSEVRHQAMLSKLDLQHAELKERLRNIYYQMPKRGSDKSDGEE